MEKRRTGEWEWEWEWEWYRGMTFPFRFRVSGSSFQCRSLLERSVMAAVLYVIHHSPWSERARWALDHHRVAFEEREHVPLIGEIALRARSGKWSGKVSVPLFIDPATKATVAGSTAIAEHAEELARGSTLFPAGSREAMRALEATVEPILDTARARYTSRLRSDREAQIEAVPPWMRLPLVASPSARLGSWFIARKYDSSFQDIDERLRAGLQSVREALSGRAFLYGDAFSYADILAASALQGVAPVADRFLEMGPATRRLWTHPELAREFADLVAWRDALYEKHRAKPGQLHVAAGAAPRRKSR